MIPQTPGIYKLLSISTGLFYIGAAVNMYRRTQDHKRWISRNSHYNSKIRRHFEQYPISDLNVEIIEECDKSCLLEKESYWINTLNPYFNIGNQRGIKSATKNKYIKKGKPEINKGALVSSKPINRINSNGEVKTYKSLSSVKDDGFTFQNVHRAIKRGHKHHGFTWEYQVDLTTKNSD